MHSFIEQMLGISYEPGTVLDALGFSGGGGGEQYEGGNHCLHRIYILWGGRDNK